MVNHNTSGNFSFANTRLSKVELISYWWCASEIDAHRLFFVTDTSMYTIEENRFPITCNHERSCGPWMYCAVPWPPQHPKSERKSSRSAAGNRQTRDTTLCNYDKWVLSCAVLSWQRGRLGWNCHRGSPTSWVMRLSCPALNYCCQFIGCGISSLHKVTPHLQLTKFTVMNKMTDTVGKQLWSPL